MVSVPHQCFLIQDDSSFTHSFDKFRYHFNRIMNSEYDDDNDLLALIDVQRPSTRGGRRSKVKKKVTFSNDVKTSSSGSGVNDRTQINGSGDNEKLLSKYQYKSQQNVQGGARDNEQVPVDKRDVKSLRPEQQEDKLKSFSSSSRGGSFTIGSIDELLSEQQKPLEIPETKVKYEHLIASSSNLSSTKK